VRKKMQIKVSTADCINIITAFKRSINALSDMGIDTKKSDLIYFGTLEDCISIVQDTSYPYIIFDQYDIEMTQRYAK
jgi:hypothetical protein